MASMKLGSKPDSFQRDGQTWVCATGLPSDVVIEVADVSFHLHKFPLLSRSGLLEKKIGDLSGEEGLACKLQLPDLPGGVKAFELVARFCYGIKVELTASNVVVLRCAAEHLLMTEDYGEGNLIAQTEAFLNEVFNRWEDSIKALETCEDALPQAEDLHIVSRCIDSLAIKACADPALLTWPLTKHIANDQSLWNGIRMGLRSKNAREDWWYEDVASLNSNLYKRLILAVEAKGMSPEQIAGSVMFYAERHLPGLNRHSSFQESLTKVPPGTTISVLSENDQRTLLEELVDLMPMKKGVTSAKFLLGLLRVAMILHACPSCRENLEKRIGAQLDEAALEDLLIPNLGYTVETLYDIDCIQRIADHFMSLEQSIEVSSPCIVDEEQLMGSPSPSPMTMVAKLVDGYLAEVAPDVNLKFQKFQSLAAVIPDYARTLDDGIYRAIDIYLKSHPWLTDSEREHLCQLMNCQKLSLEACTHAAQNERLPLRVVVQVLFFEQLRLRTSIAGWFLVSDNLEGSNAQANLGLIKHDGTGHIHPGAETIGTDDMRLRVLELEKECMNMRQEIQKLGKTKSSWSILARRLLFRSKQPRNDMKEASTMGKLEAPKN